MLTAARNRCYVMIKSTTKKVITEEEALDDAWDVLDEIEGRPAARRADDDQPPGWKPWMPRGMQPVLEELPKWQILVEVLDDIEQTMTAHPAPFSELPRNTAK